jgi:hypothetical protein
MSSLFSTVPAGSSQIHGKIRFCADQPTLKEHRTARTPGL